LIICFHFFSLRVPASVKDVLVLYAATGGVLYRTLSYEEPSPSRAQLKAQFPDWWRTDLRMLVGNIRAAVVWPYYVSGVLRHPSFLIRSSLGYHGRMPPLRSGLSPSRRTEVMQEMLSYVGRDATVICNERQLLGVYAIALLAAVLGLVILNTAIDRLSGVS
jgi:hypothetical protein